MLISQVWVDLAEHDLAVSLPARGGRCRRRRDRPGDRLPPHRSGTVSRCSSMSTTPTLRFLTAHRRCGHGVSFEVCADPRLVPALTALGYDRQSGNRFIRTQGTRASSSMSSPRHTLGA